MYSPQVCKHTTNITTTKIGNFVEPSKYGTTMAWKNRMLAMIHDTFTGSKIVFMSIGTLLVVQICFANWQISLKRWWIQQQICFMFKLHGCWLLYFGTALARNLGDCQIFYIYSNIILDLLGLTNLGTKCEEVVCKYEQVRELRFETAISVCILHFASCIFQNLPVAQTYFSESIHKVDLQLWYVGLQI